VLVLVFLADATMCSNWCTSANITAGTATDMSGNTLGCRINYLKLVSTPNTTDPNCGYGLPGGGGVCGGYCEDYCFFQQNSVCNATYQINSAGTFYYNECVQLCNYTFPTTGGDVDISNSPVSSSNSVQCRVYHTIAAQAYANPSYHCPHASITGGGVCGADPCVPYCAAVDGACTGNNLAYDGGTTGQCLPICQNFIPNPSSRLSQIWGTSGLSDANAFDDVACRAYHGGIPSILIPSLHCAHAQQLGGGQCGTDYCAVYNRTYSQICNPIRKVLYPGNDDLYYFCNLAAASGGIPFNGSAITDTTMDTIQCREYHMLAGWVFNLTGIDPTGIPVHCPHADEMGGNTCGPICNVYCRVFTDVCGANAAYNYTDTNDCLAKCTNTPIPIANNAAATSGNSVECRIYHAYAALTTSMLDYHCPHASLSGGGVCVGSSTSGSSTSGSSTSGSATSGSPTPGSSTPTTSNSGTHFFLSLIFLALCVVITNHM